MSGACDGNNSSFSKLSCEVLDNGNTRDLKNHPLSDLPCGIMGDLSNDPACNLSQSPLTDLPCGVIGLVGSEDAFSLVGQQAHSKKQDMEVSSPIKPIADQREKKGATLEVMGQGSDGKIKATAQWKRLAREKGKNKSLGKEVKFISCGSKRVGK